MASPIITSVRFSTAAQNQIIVHLDDGSQFKTTWPLKAPTQAFVQPWIDAGNTPAPFQPDWAGLIAAKRWQVEQGGTVWNTYPVHTDDRSQQKIMAERMAAKDGLRTDGEYWKFADGVPRALTNLEAIALADHIRTFIKNCFAVEFQKLQEVASTGTTDLNTGWPT